MYAYLFSKLVNSKAAESVRKIDNTAKVAGAHIFTCIHTRQRDCTIDHTVKFEKELQPEIPV